MSRLTKKKAAPVNPVVVKQWSMDPWLLGLALVLMAVGVLLVASSSLVISDHHFGYPFHYLTRHVVYLVLGLTLLALFSQVPLKWWSRLALPFFIFVLLLLVLVLVPGVGRLVNGARRWLGFAFFTVQVSELAKLAVVIYFSDYCVRYADQISARWQSLLVPLGLLSVMSVLLLLEPDFGSTAVVVMTAGLIFFLSGARLKPFAIILSMVAVAFLLLVYFSPYRIERLISFLNPWQRAFGSGYQLTQSLIAFGRGGFFGVGLGNSMQKLFYLPEAHTDFLFAVLAEELGLMGSLAVLLLFSLLIWRLFYWGAYAAAQSRYFLSKVMYGIGIWLGLQAFINMGVTIGLLPTKGITLPFISYGGSSLLVCCAVIGIALRVSYELKHQDCLLNQCRSGHRKKRRKQYE